MTLSKSTPLHAFGGFFLMGGWAFFANSAHPMPTPLVAGVLQGALTACITLVLKTLIERIHQRSAGPMRLILPPLCAGLSSLTLLTLFHSAAGTPALLTTISVPLIVSTTYSLLYTLRLNTHD